MRTSGRVQARNVSVEAEATRPDSDPSLPPPPPPADTEHLSSLLSMNVRGTAASVAATPDAPSGFALSFQDVLARERPQH